MFELQSDDSIRFINHIGRVPISMEEAEKRLNAFRNLFSKELFRRGSVPPLMDKERGGVAALSDYYAAAQVEGYTIHYGFTGSFQPGKPLLPEFAISLRTTMEAVELPIRRKIVEPPAGYEWYSLDPKVNTPDPGTKLEAVKQPEANLGITEAPQLSSNEPKQKAVETKVTENSKKTWLWIVGLLASMSVAGYFAKRHFSKPRM